MAQLQIISGNDRNRVFDLHGDKVTIGRNPKNNIVLFDETASRFHAEIFLHEGRHFIRDLDSSHGTYINSERIVHDTPLLHDTIISIGSTEMVFKEPDRATSDEASTPSPAAQLIGGAAAPEAKSKPLLPEEFSDTVTHYVSATGPLARSANLSDAQSEMLIKVADAIHSVLDRDVLLKILADMLHEIFTPDRVLILLTDPQTGELRLAAQKPEREEQKISNTIVEYAMREKISLLISNTADDERFSEAQSVIRQSIQSAICSPLAGRNAVLGVIYIDSRLRPINFQKDELALLNIISTHAAMSIENAMLVEQKVAAERLSAMGVAVAGISHYIKNIITGLLGSSGLINMGLESGDLKLVEEAWPIQERATQKIHSLVQQMLTLSKKREPEWGTGNLNALMTDVIDNQERRAHEFGVVLQCEFDPDLPDTMFDAQQLHDALLNLTGNAIEACAETENACVKLATKQCDGGKRLAVVIEDNGPGIPQEIQEKIFEPFFSTKGAQGTGLGLAVTRKVIEEHGGSLELDSEEGRGAKFTILIPRRTTNH
ncbi:FHA domain-containing protein [Candidatus Sumerlaeota bacterium]|nr:FHA domain-containing protein [Candidatus Sumerlaeota bacterium]